MAWVDGWMGTERKKEGRKVAWLLAWLLSQNRRAVSALLNSGSFYSIVVR